MALLVHETTAEALDGMAAVEIAGHPFAWKARVSADVVVHVLVGLEAVADVADYPVAANTPTDFDVPADAVVSVFAGSAGTVHVSRIG